MYSIMKMTFVMEYFWFVFGSALFYILIFAVCLFRLSFIKLILNTWTQQSKQSGSVSTLFFLAVNCRQYPSQMFSNMGSFPTSLSFCLLKSGTGLETDPLPNLFSNFNIHKRARVISTYLTRSDMFIWHTHKSCSLG